MTIPPYLYPLAAPLLIPVARQLGKQLMAVMNGQQSQPDSLSHNPAIPEHLKKNPRYVKALVEYSNRTEHRLQEFQSLGGSEEERRIQIRQQEFKDRLEISRLQRELIRELQANEIQLKLHELDQIWNQEKWFSNLSRQETERILLAGQQQHRLLMFVAPPDMSEDCPEGMRRHLKKDIANGLRRFLNQHYPQTSDLRPVEFYADYFTRPLGDIEVRKLQMVLTPVPTCILYSDINDYEVHFHVGFWGLESQNVSLIPIEPWNWESAKEELEAQGESETHAIRKIRQLIVKINQLLATFLVDWYYLNLDPNYKPQLFRFNHEFPPLWVKPYISVLKEIQQKRRETYRQELKALVQHNPKREPFKILKNPQNWSEFLTLSGNSDLVNSIAVSSNEQFLVSGGWDHSLKIWSVQTGQIYRNLRGHENSITAIAITPDSQFVVSGSVDSSVKIWSAQTGEILHTLQGHSDPVTVIAICPYSQFIASGSGDNTIKIWSIESGELLHTLIGHINSVQDISISDDAQLLYSASVDQTLKVWSLQTATLQQSFELYQPYKMIKVCANSNNIITGSWDHTIEIWRIEQGYLRQIQALSGHHQDILDLAMSPDYSYIASSSSDCSIKVWSRETGYLLRTLTGHFKEINTINFSPDGSFLVSGSSDGTIKIWQCD